jgi:serine/threonine-protein kinase
METGTIINQYKIISAIGKGGMGEVYKAEDARLHRKVALKILPAEFSSNKDRMRRFEQEATSAAALNHPNIAHIYEIGESDGTNFIAMEFIDGVTLREKIHRDKAPLLKLLKYLTQVAEGLTKAHSAGIVHRDLKPDNIMITRDDYAKILDFGLAKLVETSGPGPGQSEGGEAPTAVMQQPGSPAGQPGWGGHHSVPGMIMGTVGYMSPEQAQAKPVDQRSDIFSFGCLLYEAATGRKPFAGDSIVDTLHKIIHDPAPAITDFNPSASPELQRVIRKCLAKEPAKRYQTIRDTANDLEELIEEMKGASDIERSVAPSSSATTNSGISSTADDVRSAESTVSVSQQPASSAEYVVTGIKQHKLLAAVALLVLVGGAVALSLYLRARKTAAAIESIAVMPFVNESGNADIEYLSDGMTETLISSLSQLPNLNVKGRSSVFRYKGKDLDTKTLGKELGVQAVLYGRVSQRGDQLTLSLELLDAVTENVIWSGKYDRKQADVVSLQSEIARDVSAKLKSKLSGADEAKVTKAATANPEAYQAYLKGRYYWNRRTAETLKKAIEQFKAATDRDPNYAMAYVGLADCYVVLNEYSGIPLSETLPKAKTYAERAIAIDGQLAEPHATLGSINEYLWNWTEAEREFKRAIELNPSYATAFHWYGNFLRDTGRFDEGVSMIKRAHELDPLSSIISNNVASSYQTLNDHNASIETSLKLIELDPTFSAAYQPLGISYLKLGRNAEGITALEKAVELSNRAGPKLADLGYGYGVTGKRKEAVAIVKELEEKYAKKEAIPQNIAVAYAGLGDKDKAFEWLEIGFQTKSDILYLKWAIPYESLRDDSRYKDLMKRMGLPE